MNVIAMMIFDKFLLLLYEDYEVVQTEPKTVILRKQDNS